MARGVRVEGLVNHEHKGLRVYRLRTSRALAIWQHVFEGFYGGRCLERRPTNNPQQLCVDPKHLGKIQRKKQSRVKGLGSRVKGLGSRVCRLSG